jgi:hypothetical protein
MFAVIMLILAHELGFFTAICLALMFWAMTMLAYYLLLALWKLLALPFTIMVRRLRMG